MKKYIFSILAILVFAFSFINTAEATNTNGPTVVLNANPVNVSYGSSSTITWTVYYNATSCTGTGGTNGWAGSKSVNGGSFNTGAITSPVTFGITCSNSNGSDSDSVNITVSGGGQTQNPTVNISAYNTNVDYGGSTTVVWSGTNIGNCSCVGTGGTANWAGPKGSQGGTFYTGVLTQTVTFTITCSENGNSVTDSVTITVGAAPSRPSVTLSAASSNISYGSSTTLTWTASNANSCEATGGTNGWAGSKSVNGGSFSTGSLTSTTTYFINCYNNTGSSSASVTVSVGQQVGSAPNVTVTVNPTNINSGNSATLTWNSTNNPLSCFGSWGNWSGQLATSGSQTVSPTTTTTYYVACTNNFGTGNDTATLTVNQPNPPVINLTLSPNSISYGSSTTLSWSVTDATSCTANSNPSSTWTGTKNSSSGQEVVSSLTADTFFNLFCSGPGGSTSKTINVIVGAQQVGAPSVDLSSTSTNIGYGEGTTLNWVTTGNATSCNATGGTNGWAGSKSIAGGSFGTGALFTTTTYAITCSNNGGSDTDTITINVGAQQVNNPPTVDLYASQNNIPYNGSTNLIWTVNNATSCNATGGTNGWSGGKAATGGSFYTGSLTSTATYTITCSNNVGSTATDSVTVNVESQNITPSVSTQNATNLSFSNATLNGNVSANGGNSVYAWFEWGTNSGALYNSTNQINYGSANGLNYTYSLGGLSQNTTYYYRAVAQGQNGQLVYGNQLSFTTNTQYTGCTYNCGGSQPSVTTYNATNTTENASTLNGFVNANGSFTTTWFEWGTNSGALYNTTNKNSFGSSSGNFNQYISGLSPNNTYYYRAVAQNSSGTIYGNVLYFTTPGFTNTCGFNLNCEPQAITTLATSIGETSARLNGIGIVNGNNVSTYGYFEWGSTQSLGNKTTEGFITNNSSTPFYANVFNLAPGRTYYFRAVASNQYGTARGDIVSFRTNSTIIVDGGTSNTNVNVIYRNTTPTTNVIYTDSGSSNTNIVTRTNTVNTNINETTGVSKPSLVFLNVTNNNLALNQLGEAEYFVNYKNVSGESLHDVVLSVLLPREMEFINATAGYFSTENNTVVVNIGNLFPQQEGGLRINVRVLNTALVNRSLVVTGHLVYTINSNNTQEEVFAYDESKVNGFTNLAGASIFGGGFWPNTLIGWLLLLLVLVLIILAARIAYRDNKYAFARAKKKEEKVENNNFSNF